MKPPQRVASSLSWPSAFCQVRIQEGPREIRGQNFNVRLPSLRNYGKFNLLFIHYPVWGILL